jgi:hypothetical protein
LLDYGRLRIKEAKRVVKQRKGKLDRQMADHQKRKIGSRNLKGEQARKRARVQQLKKGTAALSIA